LLSDNAMSDFRTFAHLSPPLRSEEDRKAALVALADGTIDILCSGHDPRGPEEKRLPFADAAPGASGAETLLALSLGFGLPIERLFEMLAVNPAKVLGVDTGRLVPGQPADLMLLDPQASWQIRGEAMTARAGNTPFDGLPTQGKVLRLWKGGKEISA
jgi:dihydroorotase